MGWNNVHWSDNCFASACTKIVITLFTLFVLTQPIRIIVLVPPIGQTAAAVQRDNVTGLQFHPEKSNITGFELLTAYFSSTNLRLMLRFV